DTLAVRLVVPLAGSTGDLHPQVIRPAPPVPEQRPSRRYAPCLAHNENGRAQADPKSVLSSIAMKASFARSHDENIQNYRSMGLKQYEVIGCKDDRECSWCKSMDQKKLSVNQSINALIEENCTCDSHCRLATVAVLN
ncbi:MAG: hypothetical protein RLN85_15360, partial [Pseudomonadales bacterium]